GALDAHRGRRRGRRTPKVITGPRTGSPCPPPLTEVGGAIFPRHGFETHENVSGYTGGNIVATAGQPATRQVHALQIEINSALLVTVTWEELIALISRGEGPERAQANLARGAGWRNQGVRRLPPGLPGDRRAV